MRVAEKDNVYTRQQRVLVICEPIHNGNKVSFVAGQVDGSKWRYTDMVVRRDRPKVTRLWWVEPMHVECEVLETRRLSEYSEKREVLVIAYNLVREAEGRKFRKVETP